MMKRLFAIAIYSLFWLLFFFFARLFFIINQHESSFSNSIGELASTFLHGSKLDISTTGYYLAIPILLILPGIWFSGRWYRLIVRWYTYFLILLSSIIVVADSTLYSYWGFRMDYTPLMYLKTPAEAMASVSTFKVIVFFMSILLLAAIFIFIYRKYADSFFEGFENVRSKYLAFLFFAILTASLIIPVRGGFGIAPINAGSVYFSSKMFLNHTSVNAVWNVGTTAFTHKPVTNPYQFGDIDSALQLVASLKDKTGTAEPVLRTNKPNIMILVLESFSGYVIGPLGGDSLVTPNFNRLSREGILFTEFFASGTRTDKAMPAIFNGYPAPPAQSIIKEPKKSQSLPSLVRVLTEKGYHSSFWYGGEIDFANFNSFVIGSGFQNIITKDDFHPEDYNSKWGVHDHILFEVLKDSMTKVREPFLKVVLTLSSHEPFDVPMETVFNGSDNISKYKNSVYYADKVLGEFIEWAKTTDWWRNTLLIMVADHCGRVSESQAIFTTELFRIPMLWIGGALNGENILISKHGDQTDIPVTLLNQLGINVDFPFGKDLLSAASNSYSFYTYNEGLGFVTDSSTYVYDHKMKGSVIKEGKGADFAEKAGKAYLQVLFNDYLKR
ncbi:MAG TPA: sulfatase-like hydrolase/transferase [Bacteroidales bacterium]|nr:sulfatase-like hydrolase/transferase [Bacteroidales bacterium]